MNDSRQPGPPAASSSDGAVPASESRWLVLVYRVPSEPSRLRAAVWRRLKSLGAIYLQSAVATLPENPASDRALRKLRNQIVEEMGGTAVLLSSEPLAGGPDVVAQFNLARDEESAEIVDKCHDFLGQVEKEVVSEHFTFAELEENEEDLTKLRRWLDKVRDRDLLGAGGVTAALEALETCARTLDAYAESVYQADSEELGR